MNGFTAAVACMAVSAFGNEGAGTIVSPAMFESTLRCRDSFAPIVAATPLSSFDFSAVTAPRYAPTNAVSSAWPPCRSSAGSRTIRRGT